MSPAAYQDGDKTSTLRAPIDGVRNETDIEPILRHPAGMLITTATNRDEVSPAGAPDSGSAADWRRAVTAQHNMLLEGTEASLAAVVPRLTPYLREPVTWLGRGLPLTLPIEKCGTLVLQNIAALDRQDQARLRVWLDDPTRRTQVVSTTAYPLFPLVDCHVFDATLYYRLNLVRFCVDQE
jgi:hypothetical protein